MSEENESVTPRSSHVVGESTAGDRVKKAHAAKGKTKGPLKRFARELAKSGDVDAKQWLANKLGANEKSRSENSIKRIALEKQATKASRKGKKPGGAA
jgi:hypothetical protein